MNPNSQFLPYAIDGGLDFMSPKTGINPGSMSDCLNYEVAIRRGASLMEGYERFDGGGSPSYYSVNLLVFDDVVGPGNLTAQVAVGRRVTVTNSAGETASGITVTKIAVFQPGDNSTAIHITVALLSPLDGPYITVNSGSVTIAFLNSTPWTTVQSQYTDAANFYSTTRALVQPVPGQGPVLGLAWYKDALYAVRDYVSGTYAVGTNRPNFGDEVFQGASYGAATFKGFVAKFQNDSGDWDGGDNAAGTISFYNCTGTLTAVVFKNHTQGDVTVATIDVANEPAVGAGLYKAVGTRGTTPTTASWAHQDLGWNVSYTNGQAVFVPLNTALRDADITTQIKATEWKVATADDTNYGNNAWNSSPLTVPFDYWADLDDGATPDYDATYVLQTATGTTSGTNFKNTVRVNAFGFSDSDIPAGSYITGIEVEVVKRAHRFGFTAITVVDSNFHLLGLDDDTLQGFGDSVTAWPQNATATDNTPASWTTTTYGGSQQLLGAHSVTEAKVKTSAFGVQLGASLAAKTGSGNATAHITSVRVRIHYLPPSPKIYFWNGTSAVVANVVVPYQQSGTVGASTAAGVLYLSGVGTNRTIQGGEQIRSYPPTAGVAPDGGAADASTLIAKTQTYASKNVMDWGTIMADTSSIDKPVVSKYQHIVNNYFASAGLEALFMVSGAGPCAYYDGTNFARILTGLTITAEKPRHVCAHQQRLFLGYYAGSVQYSDITSPLSFDFTLGATAAANEIGFGAPITGVYQLNGDSLAVFTANSIQMIQGNVNAGPYPATPSPKIGSIEYAPASMGQFLFVSFRGVGALESVQSYGDFKDLPLSEQVWDWLRPRLQTSKFFESTNQGLIGTLPVKNKGQFRQYFADSYILTATFLNAGELPQYTIQKYTDFNGADTTMTIFCAGTESLGRDRIFASNDNTDGYVFELDRGSTFDGFAFTAYFDLNVNDTKTPYIKKQWQASHVHGLANDYAPFNLYRSANYDDLSSNVPITYTFGSASTVPTGKLKPFVSYGSSDLSIEGYGLNLRFQHTAVSGEGPHVIQAVAVRFGNMGEKT